MPNDLDARLASNDPTEVAAAIDSIVDLPRPVGSARPWAWPALDDALARTKSQLGAASLVKVFAATFRRVTNNFAATLVAVEELARREDVPAQRELVGALLAALEDYDSGHRERDNTVFDQLIDVHLPRLQAEPLADLLGRLDSDNLSDEGDGFGALFAPAFERARGTPLAERLVRISLGDRQRPPAVIPSAAEGAALAQAILDGSLEIPGHSGEFAEQDAKIRGLGLAREGLVAYLRLLLPHADRIDPEQLAAVEIVWRLAEPDLAWLRQQITAWNAPAVELARVLHAASRADDGDDAFTTPARRVLSETLRTWAFEVEGKAPAAVDDAEIAQRVNWIMLHQPSREARARYWLSRAKGRIKLEGDANLAVRIVLGKLQSVGQHETVVAWLPLLAARELKPYELGETLALLAHSVAKLRRADLVADLERIAPRDNRDLALAMCEATGAVDAADQLAAWFDVYTRAGGELPMEGPLAALTQAHPAFASVVAAAREKLRRAGFEGVDIRNAKVSAAVFSDLPEIDPTEIDAALAGGEKKIGLLLGRGGRYHRRLLEYVSAATEQVELDSQALSSLLRRLFESGNAAAVLEWVRAIPKIWLGDPSDVIVYGLRAAKTLGDVEAEDLLLSQVPSDIRNGALAFELTLLYVRRGNRDQVMHYAAIVLTSIYFDGREILEVAHQHADLAPYADEITALIE